MKNKTLWDYFVKEDASAATTSAGNIAATNGSTCERTSEKKKSSKVLRGKNWLNKPNKPKN